MGAARVSLFVRCGAVGLLLRASFFPYGCIFSVNFPPPWNQGLKALARTERWAPCMFSCLPRQGFRRILRQNKKEKTSLLFALGRSADAHTAADPLLHLCRSLSPSKSL